MGHRRWKNENSLKKNRKTHKVEARKSPRAILNFQEGVSSQVGAFISFNSEKQLCFFTTTGQLGEMAINH